jgi:xanthine dehydrogenase large subunit
MLNQGGALVMVFQDGTHRVNHGGTEMGQGLNTKMAQVAADGLGVPVDLVRVTGTDTQKVPNASATAASSGADINGAAINNACDQLRARLAPVAAAMLGCSADEVQLAGGEALGGGKSSPGRTWSCRPGWTGWACRWPASTRHPRSATTSPR